MKRTRLALGTVIATAAVLTVVYMLNIMLNFMLAIILCLCLSAIISTLGMALRILKDPYSTNKTFDEYFYEGPDIRHVGPE